MSKLRIGLDIDSCIADTDVSWNAYFKSMHHEHDHSYEAWAKYDEPTDAWNKHSSICNLCFSDVLHDRERVMEIELKPYALWVIEQLSKEADLWIITSRPDVVHKHTIAWLERKDIYDLVQDVIFSHEKEKVCEDLRLDYHLDDSPRHIAAIRETNTVPLIFDAIYNRDERGVRLMDWNEVYEYLRAAITMNMYAA